jgi:hypothetical protein
MRKLFFILLLSVFTFKIQAQITAGKYCSGGFFYDQDYTLEQVGFKKLNEDRNYTMGLGLQYASSKLAGWVIYEPHKWLLKQIKPLISQSCYGPSFYSFMLANGSYTPDSLPATYPIMNDRPYSSLTYLQSNDAFLNIQKHQLYTVSISLGMLGTGLSREVQTYIHTHQNDNDTKDPRTPRGWGNQISNGGSPTILIGYQQDYLITKRPLQQRENDSVTSIKRLAGEWKTAWKVNAGWYNMASGEITYRFGCIDPRNWTYATNPLGQSSEVAKTKCEKSRDSYYLKKRRGEAYVFGTLRNWLPAFLNCAKLKTGRNLNLLLRQVYPMPR